METRCLGRSPFTSVGAGRRVCSPPGGVTPPGGHGQVKGQRLYPFAIGWRLLLRSMQLRKERTLPSSIPTYEAPLIQEFVPFVWLETLQFVARSEE